MKLRVWICLSLGAFIYQAVSGRNDWLDAVQIVYFQGAAFLTLYVMERTA